MLSHDREGVVLLPYVLVFTKRILSKEEYAAVGSMRLRYPF